MLVAAVLALLLEMSVFNYSTWRSIACKSVSIASDIEIDETGHYETCIQVPNETVKNINIKELSLSNCQAAEIKVALTDEGDKYFYKLPSFRVVPAVPSTGFCNIYPYGKVTGIKVSIDLPEGSEAKIGKIEYNSKREFDIKLPRLLAAFVFFFLLIYIWKTSGYETWQDYERNGDTNVINRPTGKVNISANTDIYSNCRKGDKKQTFVIVLTIVMLIMVGRWMCTSNEKIKSCPWPHHKQYQELAVALDNGSVRLDNKNASDELLASDNPYDTSALLAEGVEYEMDYAYYKGSYYVYFGIIPELMLYYPYYKLTGRPLSNCNAQTILFAIMVVGVFLTLWRLCFKFGSSKDNCNTPFWAYMMLAIGYIVLSNNVYLVSRADIYNIPIMAATAFSWMGIGLWLTGLEYDDDKKISRCIAFAMGSLCMAAVAGCRPQMLLLSITGIFLFVIRGDEAEGNNISFRNRLIIKKGKIAESISVILPYILVAIVVGGYNYARFGSIFDFGATYSLTSNDMNHRGFNFDRLFKGLYSFFLQPSVYSMDFPYLRSSIVESSYMGKNLTEFVFGGCFVSNFIYLSIFTPAFVRLKKMTFEMKSVFIALITVVFVIACFDINGAGILYRYICDFVPALYMAAAIIWIYLINTLYNRKVLFRLLGVIFICGICFGFMVLMADSGGIGLRNDSIVLYEHIRECFRL